MSTARELWRSVATLAIIAVSLFATKQSVAGERSANAYEERILKALDEQAEFELVETPLGEIAELISERYSIPVLLDKHVMDEEGIDVDSPITIHVEGIPLKSAPDLIFRPNQLEWVVHNDVLLVTTIAAAQDSYMDTKVYRVGDLLRGDDLSPARYDAFAHVITSSVGNEEDWEETGGPGRLDFFDEMMVVKQTRRLHTELANLLEALREARLATALGGTDEAAPPNELQTITYSIMTPTEQLVRRISNFGLGDWVLPASEKENAKKSDSRARPSDEEAHAFCERLAEAITALVEPESWDGPGTIQPVPGALIIRHFPAVHAEIRQVVRNFMPPDIQATSPGGFVRGEGGGGFGGGGQFNVRESRQGGFF